MKGRWRKDKSSAGCSGHSSASSLASSALSSACASQTLPSGEASTTHLWSKSGKATDRSSSEKPGASVATSSAADVETAGFFSRQRLAKVQAEKGDRDPENAGAVFACKSMKQSEFALCDASSFSGFKKALEGGSIYLPNFCCDKDDFSIFNNLLRDVQRYAEEQESSDAASAPPRDSSSSSSASSVADVSSSVLPFAGTVTWSRHLKHENPSFSPTFRRVIAQLSSYFDVEVYATRMNLYMNGSHWKPLHKDSHAYSPVTHMQEDFTVGASFGASRELEFVHDTNDTFRFAFPQHNGDVFAFNCEVNKAFKHGVPAVQSETHGLRFSVVLWGRRRKLTKRNAGVSELRREGILP
ncbi:conserved hypothetical protein [Neospora caninum Liverpool]|uniref:Alpha-ketoglutarate-dependent dioxygenase AlkB-like domain-containing protein n=1 Tax=Neospora caninum (strain Liverpool) TaxID=572307 RepID=F0VF05_NEOCL|nr:conserved hypothetical protein [Neospora caninum Liverpool]CBZ52299.1 conserved hypothetical protein [Neospora caninum Liverpool]CEL66267.1 TPA: hypothetical protein BN1204_020860 [Neospora caninum Liverpool]|eukprot:XP_003882331.1 conserved hypothetical protein [Neospora caninum Liverpool]